MACAEFIEFLKEVLSPLGAIHAKKMFGGYGIYHDGLMFALVEDDVLYLKADETTAPLFIARGAAPFQYQRAGKWVEMSYYQAPEEIYEEVEAAMLWAKRAFGAALKARS